MDSLCESSSVRVVQQRPHEMGFARKVADRVIFMDRGEIVEVGAPETFFSKPQNERTKLFLSQVLGH